MCIPIDLQALSKWRIRIAVWHHRKTGHNVSMGKLANYVVYSSFVLQGGYMKIEYCTFPIRYGNLRPKCSRDTECCPQCTRQDNTRVDSPKWMTEICILYTHCNHYDSHWQSCRWVSGKTVYAKLTTCLQYIIFYTNQLTPLNCVPVINTQLCLPIGTYKQLQGHQWSSFHSWCTAQYFSQSASYLLHNRATSSGVPHDLQAKA